MHEPCTYDVPYVCIGTYTSALQMLYYKIVTAKAFLVEAPSFCSYKIEYTTWVGWDNPCGIIYGAFVLSN